MHFTGRLGLIMLIVVSTIVIMYQTTLNLSKSIQVVLLNNKTEEQKKDKGLLLEEQKKDKGLLLEEQKKDKGLLLEEQKKDKGLLLAVGVLNRLHLKKRRDVIRMTWFKVCKQKPKLVRCNFFTDSFEGLKKPEVGTRAR